VIDLSDYMFETLREGPEFVLRSGRNGDSNVAVVTLAVDLAAIESRVLTLLEESRQSQYPTAVEFEADLRSCLSSCLAQSVSELMSEKLASELASRFVASPESQTPSMVALPAANRALDAGSMLYSDLLRSEAFLAEGQRLSNTGSWSRNIATGKLVWSEQNYRIFGRDPKSAAPPTFDEFVGMIHPEDLTEWRKTAEPAISEGRVFAHEFRIVLPTGVVKHVYTMGRPIFDEAGVASDFVGTTIDISDRKRKEDELRDAQAELAHVARFTTMGELTASIAHEVNQPLAAMVTNAETALLLLAKRPPEPHLAIKAVERIVRDGRHAGDVIKSIRAMLRKSKPEVAELNINELVQDVLDLVRGELRRLGISLETDLSGAVRPLIGDKVQLQQVVVNLIKNGIEAMTNVTGRARLLRVSSALDAATGRIRVAVEDTGEGLAESTRARLFEPFYTTKPQGMGMGLSICRSIVEAHSGELSASARSPFGSVFEFTLPLPATQT
jgi:PAS domain S-box-containing protein